MSSTWCLGKLSKLGFGCEPLGGSDWGDVDLSQIGAAITMAVERSVNFFDTAAVYGLGLSEKRLSKCLGNKRHEVFISTKAGFRWRHIVGKRAEPVVDCDHKQIVASVHDSLERLDIDVIPLLFVHYPDKKTTLEELVETLEGLKRDGKIANIGYSNFSISALRKLRKLHCFDAVQFEYSLLHRERELDIIPFCRSEGITSMAYGPLCRGLLGGKFNKDNNDFPSSDRRSRLKDFRGDSYKTNLRSVGTLDEYSSRYEIPVSAIAIRWLQQYSDITSTIAGVKTLEQFEENLESLNFDLSAEDVESISEIFSGKGECSELAASI